MPVFLLIALVLAVMPAAQAGDGAVTFIHIGDLHGHLIPRPDMRHGSPSHGQTVGGLAHVYSRIQEIRGRHPQALLVNTGDTIQGSAEALYTSGQAMVDILNNWKIDAFAAGNWDFVYGTERFREFWAGENPKAPWGALAANLYYATLYDFPQTPYGRFAGKRVLPPYSIRQAGNVKVGMIGLVADRPPQAVTTHVTDGFTLTPGLEELEALVPHLRKKERVDLVVLISERGLAGNLDLVERVPGVDVVLSSDMHEETWRVLRARSGTILLEEGQDGTMVGELTVTVAGGRMTGHTHMAHRITTRANPPDARTAEAVNRIRESFVKGPAFKPHSNPMSGAVLRVPIDTVVGHTKKALHRSNYSDAPEMPAVVEGSSHDFLADSFRAGCKSEVGVIRGFRYGTHIAPGPIKLEDLYHYMPIGPQIACGDVTGEQIRWQIEKSARGALTKWVDDWTGGWLYAWSGVTFDLDPSQEYGFMASNIRVNGEPLDPERDYQIAGYWYVDNSNMINRMSAERIRVLRDADGGTVDATEVVAHYLQSLPTQTVDPEINRIRLLKKLPPPIGANREIQPLKGVPRPDY
jgi:2',3'-cyclic-nucleotide 2'-phosphodiesterase (5'-nucleotidase family)